MESKPKTITVSDAARNFADVINRAYYRGERFLLTRGGKPVAEIRPIAGRGAVIAQELGERLAHMPHLGADEAGALARELSGALSLFSRSEPITWD